MEIESGIMIMIDYDYVLLIFGGTIVKGLTSSNFIVIIAHCIVT